MHLAFLRGYIGFSHHFHNTASLVGINVGAEFLCCLRVSVLVKPVNVKKLEVTEIQACGAAGFTHETKLKILCQNNNEL